MKDPFERDVKAELIELIAELHVACEFADPIMQVRLSRWRSIAIEVKVVLDAMEQYASEKAARAYELGRHDGDLARPGKARP